MTYYGLTANSPAITNITFGDINSGVNTSEDCVSVTVLRLSDCPPFRIPRSHVDINL